ncbi:MAG: peptide ligase PGM1-related protein [Hyphomicrobiales bacterium]
MTDVGDVKRECADYKSLQAQLPDMFKRVFPDRMHPRTVLIVPSLTLDPDVLSKISGAHHYEERMLCLLLLLRLPRTQVIYVTSEHISEAVIDYFLHLLPGVPHQHARQRLTLLSCHDASSLPLTQKILDRPRLLARIEHALGDRALAHMACFNVSPLERTLAVRLGIPIYGCDPDLLPLGSKSGGRALFREAGVPIPDGFEDLGDEGELVQALADLKDRNPDLRNAVVKLNEGFSGEGNAVFRFDGAPAGRALETWVRDRTTGLAFEAKDMSWDLFRAKIKEMGGVVEAFVEGEDKRSPSAQYRIDPSGQLEPVSTHDQVLGGNAGQVFLGCRFPADEDYRLEVQAEGLKAARLLLERGVLGRFGVDFISVRNGGGWRHYAIEINLRKGGTTHPFIMLQYLTDGSYDPDTGLFMTPDGRPRFYYASDNLESDRYKGLTPPDLIDIAVSHGIHFHGATQQGVVFHLIGALSEFGKVGAVCVGNSHDRAQELYRETVGILDREGAA